MKYNLDMKGIFQLNNDRSKNIVKHISYSFVYKFLSVLANFMLVPLSVSYLGVTNYGVWLTISSFIGWFSFFDVGLGNGLRNKFSESKAKNQISVTRAYISTAYFAIAAICVLLFFTFLLLNFFVDWTTVFSLHTDLYRRLSLLMPIVFGFFCLQLTLKLIVTIYTADQNHSMPVKVQFITQFIVLFFVWLLTQLTESSLLLYGVVITGLPIVVLFLLSLLAFSGKYKDYKPRLLLFSMKNLKSILGLGFKFFVVQIAAIVLFSTDNFIIIKLFGPEEVVPYNIAFKYFSIVTIVYSVVIVPFWSSFTDAYAKNDFIWIKNAVKRITKIWLLVPCFLILMLLCSSYVYSFWVGEQVIVPMKLSFSMAFFTLLTTFNMIFVNFINGVGKIKLQLITSIISLIINIPLSVFFSKYLGLGVSGVILATCFSLIYSVILRPLQYYKIINNKAKGLWNE